MGRTITGFGPTKQTVTSTGNTQSSWIKFGPFNADAFGAQITFATATSGAVCKIQGTLTTATTAGIQTLVSQTGNNNGTYKHSTYSSGVFAFVRLSSTADGNSTAITSNLMTAYFGAY